MRSRTLSLASPDAAVRTAATRGVASPAGWPLAWSTAAASECGTGEGGNTRDGHPEGIRRMADDFPKDRAGNKLGTVPIFVPRKRDRVPPGCPREFGSNASADPEDARPTMAEATALDSGTGWVANKRSTAAGATAAVGTGAAAAARAESLAAGELGPPPAGVTLGPLATIDELEQDRIGKRHLRGRRRRCQSAGRERRVYDESQRVAAGHRSRRFGRAGQPAGRGVAWAPLGRRVGGPAGLADVGHQRRCDVAGRGRPTGGCPGPGGARAGDAAPGCRGPGLRRDAVPPSGLSQLTEALSA
jgi:hypothetical protein